MFHSAKDNFATSLTTRMDRLNYFTQKFFLFYAAYIIENYHKVTILHERRCCGHSKLRFYYRN